MNADRLLAHFDRIADAPDAVPRLRRFILDLAVRGKLVEQDPNDEPASELLKRVARTADNGRKQQLDLKECNISGATFDVPEKWSLDSFDYHREMGDRPGCLLRNEQGRLDRRVFLSEGQ